MPSLFTRFSHIAMLFMLPLCTGAIWFVAAQILRDDLPGFAVVVALSLWVMRGLLDYRSRRSRLLLHAAAVAIGIVYAQLMIAAAAVAGQFGRGVYDTLALMGSRMTLDLIITRAGVIDAAMIVSALLLAIWIGAGSGKARPRPRSAP